MRQKDVHRASDRIDWLLLPLGVCIVIGHVFRNVEPQSDIMLFPAMCVFTLCVLQHVYISREERDQSE